MVSAVRLICLKTLLIAFAYERQKFGDLFFAVNNEGWCVGTSCTVHPSPIIKSYAPPPAFTANNNSSDFYSRSALLFSVLTGIEPCTSEIYKSQSCRVAIRKYNLRVKLRAS